MWRAFGLALIVCVLGVTACGGGGTGGSGGGQVEGVSWVLVSYRSAGGATQQVPPAAEVTARFDQGTVAGNAGCNSYSGPYNLSGSDLTVGDIASTAMACPPPLDRIEQAYLTNLQASATYATDGPILTIRDDAGEDLLAYRERADLPLTGTTWTMTSVNNGQQAVVSAVAGTPVTLTLSDDGSASGSSGCNQYSGSYTTDGGTLSFGPLASTQMACADPDLNEQEQAYLAALSTVATYRLEGTRLDLMTADGSLAVSYVGAAGASS
jgi:heat shock protein HslJ